MVYIKADARNPRAANFSSRRRAESEVRESSGIRPDSAPDAVLPRLTEIAASGELAPFTRSPHRDDNLQAVFEYLVKS